MHFICLFLKGEPMLDVYRKIIFVTMNLCAMFSYSVEWTFHNDTKNSLTIILKGCTADDPRIFILPQTMQRVELDQYGCHETFWIDLVNDENPWLQATSNRNRDWGVSFERIHPAGNYIDGNKRQAWCPKVIFKLVDGQLQAIQVYGPIQFGGGAYCSGSNGKQLGGF